MSLSRLRHPVRRAIAMVPRRLMGGGHHHDAHHGPVLTDKIYRKEKRAAPTEPLDEDDDLIFDDGTAPEFVLDSLNEAPSLQVALGRLGGALGFLGGVFVLAAGYHTLFRDDRQAPRDMYPFDNLHLERGQAPSKSPTRMRELAESQSKAKAAPAAAPAAAE